MSYFPMMVELQGVKCLVIGGGDEGLKKIKILKEFGAEVTLIDGKALPEAVKLSDTYLCREYEDRDISEDQYKLVVASTDDRELNMRISNAAYEKRIPVNVVDDTELCSFIFPAIIKDKEVVCAVSSGGRSPYVAQHVKGLIKSILPPDIGDINEEMGALRAWAKKEFPDTDDRRSFLRQKLDELLSRKTD